MEFNGCSEEDIIERLTNTANEDHRDFIYPDFAKAVLELLKNKDDEIKALEE